MTDRDQTEVDEQRRELMRWAWRLPVLLALGGAGAGGIIALRVHFGKGRPDPNPSFESRPPLRVAAVSELATVWAAVPFSYETIPSILLRLPEAIPGGLSHDGAHFAAFSRICTHQRCLVELNTSPEAIAVATNHRTDRPALICGCHLSVFEPDDAGRAVSGPAVEPLPRLALELRDGALHAVGLERT